MQARHHTCCVPKLVESLVVKALATEDSPLWVIPLHAKSNVVREGRVERAAARCWTPESPKRQYNVQHIPPGQVIIMN